MEYIGILENNDFNGEQFGYYFEDTQEVREYLETIMDMLPENSEFEVILDPIDHETLMHLDEHDENEIMKRVNIYSAEDQPWEDILSSDFEENIPFSKGRCFVEEMDLFDREKYVFSENNYDEDEDEASYDEDEDEDEDEGYYEDYDDEDYDDED